jgi:DNA-binding MarR family transcriptional regulator
MTPSHAEIHDLMRQWRAVMSASRPRWAAADLTFMQLRGLSLLAQEEPIRVSGFAERLGVGLASASALADRMVRHRLVSRRSDPTDRRIVLLALSPQGRRLLGRLERGSTDHFGKLIERMTPAERDALATTLRAFVRLGAEYAVRKGPGALVTVERIAKC